MIPMPVYRQLRPVLSGALLLLSLAAAPLAAQPECAGENLLERLAENDPERHAAILAGAATVENNVGNFWLVEKPGIAPSYLFGTVHLSDDRAIRFLPVLRDELGSARILLVELDRDQQGPAVMAAAVARHALLPEGETLDSRLTAAQASWLAAETARHGMPWFQARKYRAGFLATVLSIPPCAKMALLRGERVQDMRIADLAAAAGLEVRGLEKAEEQLAAIGALDGDRMLAAIIESQDLGEQFSVDLFETTVALYAQERTALIDAIIDALPADLPRNREAAAELRAVLVAPRNRLMATRALPELEKGGAFVAVGALHLPGPDGLVALVRDAGFSVTRIGPDS